MYRSVVMPYRETCRKEQCQQESNRTEQAEQIRQLEHGMACKSSAALCCARMTAWSSLIFELHAYSGCSMVMPYSDTCTGEHMLHGCTQKEGMVSLKVQQCMPGVAVKSSTSL